VWVTVAAVVLLVATAVPGPFTIDEANAVASLAGLDQDGFALPGTRGLPPSRDLFWFDPSAFVRAPDAAVTSTVPPLHAVIAWPFARLGFRGLVLLQVLALVVLAWLLASYVRRFSEGASAPVIAVCALVFGGYSIEYAQGIWPHLLASACTFACFVLASRTRVDAALGAAFCSGLLGGIAAGLRYQDVLFAAAVGLGVLLFSVRRLAASASFATGAAIPLLISSAINHARFGWWHPLSKGYGYATPPPIPGAGGTTLLGPVDVFWARVVDLSRYPVMGSATGWSWEQDAFGAFQWAGSVKRAWLQSSPWIALALVILASAFLSKGREPAQQKELRASALVVGSVLVFFAWAGFGRHEGHSFNARYFIELVPLAAAALAIGLGAGWSVREATFGALSGTTVAIVSLVLEPGTEERTWAMLDAPFLFVPVLLTVFVFSRVRAGAEVWLRGLVAAAIAWSFVTHLGNDVRGSRMMREANALQWARLESVIPGGSALVAFGPASDGAGMLLLDRDVVLVDPIESLGADSPRLVKALREAGRRVFVDVASVPPEVFERVKSVSDVVVVRGGEDPILELVAPGSPR